MQSTRCA